MSSADYDSRYHYQTRPRHDSYYSRHEDSVAAAAREKLTAMRPSPSSSRYSASDYSYEPRAPPPLPRRSAAAPQHSSPYTSQYSSSPPRRVRKQTWPPSPSVEDETAALTKEVRPPAGAADADGEPPVHTRGTVDQEKLMEEIEQPDDLRYTLVSDPTASSSSSSARDHRRKSFAERGNMAPIKTDVDEPPMFTERVSTPYAYTRPQKESTAPSRAEFLSPEALTPASASAPRYTTDRDDRDSPRDQNARPAKSAPSYSRHDSYSRSSPVAKDDVFDDSDLDPDDTTHLRTAERKPARYSFVKSDLQKEDLRTNLHDYHPKPEPRRRESGERPQPPPTFRKTESSSSSKDNPYEQSPRSSSSSLNSGSRKSRTAPVETGYFTSSRAPSRPSSPLQRVPSPKLPSRLRESPPSSRPTSRGNTRPASPLAFSSTVRPPSPRSVPEVSVDRQSTYPPVTRDRSRPPSRMSRYDSMPEPTPRIDVQSPSPARPPVAESALPYPVDDRPLGVFMPAEEHYQFDHSTIPSPRQPYPDSPRIPSSPVPGSPRLRDEDYRPRSNIVVPEDPARSRRTRSNSVRSEISSDSRREQPVKASTKYDLNRPLPSCPRSTPTTKYDDWYSFKGHRYFDVCPSCFEGVFAGTPFAVEFAQTRLGERPTERVCDFSSPWMRLAWLLTIKQRMPSLELVHAVADIAEIHRPCPEDREVGIDRVSWYGIPDQRDGVHIANFAICSSDRRMIEALLPTMRGYFTPLPSSYSSGATQKHMCALRTSSRRFPKYLDLLVELDAEAQDLNQRPKINRFIQMARDNAFKSECGRGKASFRKPWLFIPSLPEFTVCEECYDELIWPACQSRSNPTTIPRLFNKAMQLVPNEDPDVGSSCCLYSSRMRRIFDVAVKDADFAYLKRKVLDRKRAEGKLTREKKDLVNWMAGLERGSSQWERAKADLRSIDKEWASWE
ncbi:hypothetical protein IQ06DRAFT_298974 [Phaeosphaeriaceae sp. SRC1lsM3a]|nr:hypothetical protein IQ06DRAFT_298974 [Stagonospora sp. SRC1lsM3a]